MEKRAKIGLFIIATISLLILGNSILFNMKKMEGYTNVMVCHDAGILNRNKITVGFMQNNLIGANFERTNIITAYGIVNIERRNIRFIQLPNKVIY